MTKNKKAQRARQRKSKDKYLHSLRIAATSVAEMLTYMPGLNMVNIDMEKAILAAPDYNYYEKLMLHHINNCARAALALLGNAEQARAQSVDKTKEMSHDLREHMQWLINTAVSVNSGDTGWSDLLSDVLKSLHKASDTAGEYGPAWLEYSWDDVDDQSEGYKAAAAAQLEREGLALRRKRMFTATQRRQWQDLEVQVEDDDAEIQELEEEEHALDNGHRPASWPQRQQQQRLESTFQAAALTDATDCMAVDDDLVLFAPLTSAQQLSEQEWPALGTDPAAAPDSTPGDVYTAMAADSAEYEAEIAMQQQHQPPPPPRSPSQPPPPPPRNQQQQQPSPRQQQQQPAGRGRGRARAGRGSAMQNYQEQQQQRLQQQQQQQAPAPPTKGKSMGAPLGWSPGFAGRAATSPPATEFEPCFRNEDFLDDDQMPAAEDLKPVITVTWSQRRLPSPASSWRV